MIFDNPAPQTIFHKEVTFSTINEDSNESISEGYFVQGPGNNVSVSLSPYVKAVKISPPGVNGEGTYWIKFHIPDPNDSTKKKMYITFCVQAGTYQGGYYDYRTGIPEEYRKALLAWIRNFSTNQTVSGVKNLNFTVYGSITNKPTQAQNFQVSLAFNNMNSTALGGGAGAATGASGNVAQG